MYALLVYIYNIRLVKYISYHIIWSYMSYSNIFLSNIKSKSVHEIFIDFCFIAFILIHLCI